MVINLLIGLALSMSFTHYFQGQEKLDAFLMCAPLALVILLAILVIKTKGKINVKREILLLFMGMLGYSLYLVYLIPFIIISF